MVSITESAAKVTAATKTIKVKDVFIRDNCLCDEDGNDVLERIAEMLIDPETSISFNIKFEVPED